MDQVNWVEVAIVILSLLTAVVVFLAALARFVIAPIYRLARFMDREFTNGADPESAGYVGFREEMAELRAWSEGHDGRHTGIDRQVTDLKETIVLLRETVDGCPVIVDARAGEATPT